jgi:uncharacterized membrane protein YgdD (TMEM256/DUF423 family)
LTLDARTFWTLGGILALTGVAAGAFGAHILRDQLSADAIAVYETAARYQMYHSLALLAVAYAATQWSTRFVIAAGWLFVTGIVLFSGSLYLLSLLGIRWMGAITPLGGAAFLAGWLCLILGAWRG